MSVVTDPSLASRLENGEGKLAHVVCGNDTNRALCGLDASRMTWVRQPDEIDCVVCTDLDDSDDPCPVCGTHCWGWEDE